MECFVSYFPSSISAKEKDDWTENSRTLIQMRDLKIQTGGEITREPLGSLHQCQPPGPNKLPPCLLLEGLGNKKSCYYQKKKNNLRNWGRNGQAILRQVFKYHFKQKESNKEHLNMPRSQEGQVMI